jgi:hypothetical protein
MRTTAAAGAVTAAIDPPCRRWDRAPSRSGSNREEAAVTRRLASAEPTAPAASGLMPTWARLPLRLGAIGAVLAAGAACATTHSPAARSSAGSSIPPSRPGSGSAYTWSVPSGTMPATVTTGLQQALHASHLATDLRPGLHADIQQVHADTHHAALYGIEKEADGTVLPTEPLVLLATQTGRTWRLFTTTDPGFCPALRSMPAAVADDTLKAYFGGC